ncbi:HlyD family efflux transporter periplasmic adaptor subunit [uncultured Ruminococcus sp.]|uniref:HlyD family secretion protein n=1 Tax=uncultured Ruminococcus sp. TaxID=165186 RepID=UPI002594408B|nr:HlyD family efflux transporter periplasmic adaptor subunit [uncultured Ruminococcus sp.]
MTKKTVKNMADLKDSRLLYEKDLPPFGYMLVSIIAILLIAVLIWSLKTPKTFVIKSQDTIESTNKNYIMSPYTGKISKMNISEGSFVDAGDVLFTVESTELDLQEEQISGQIQVYSENVSQLKKLEQSVMDGENHFDITKADDRQYYNQYEAYMSQIKQNDIDTSTYKAYGYSDAQIETELEKNNAKISEIYYSTLKSIDESITQYETEIEKLKVQNGAIANGQSEYQVLANTSGIVHMINEYKEGMVVQAAGAIGSIANENDQYVVTAYLGVNDRPRVSPGDSVNIEVVGLAQNTYGNLKGKLISVDNDISTSQNGEQSFFKSKIEIETPYLISSKGNKVNISNGMSVEARIIYDELTYFDYLLESLGLLTRD